MLFRSSAHPGKAVRLGYCMNLHAAETLDELIAGMERVTLPLRERLARNDEFGVGMYLPAQLARELASNAAQLARLKNFLDEHALDPFTFNAFPYGGFQTDGLKERVFEPTWSDAARMAFTLDVAEVAVQLARRAGPLEHISISTHCGAHSSHFTDAADRERKLGVYADGFARVATSLAELESKYGRRVVLSLEPEPRSSANDLLELNDLFRRVRTRDAADFQRHVGVCVDTCHSAVEFEQVSWLNFPQFPQLRESAGVGKLQFSSAVALFDPVKNARGREQLFAMDEPRYLHQVTGKRAAGGCLRAGDLSQLREQWERADSWWRSTDEWRCHFHVPVDLERLGRSELTTTRHVADEALRSALEAEVRGARRSDELHVEIETYTWDVLPRAARGAGELVDGLEREYRHVIGELGKAGWKHASS